MTTSYILTVILLVLAIGICTMIYKEIEAMDEEVAEYEKFEDIRPKKSRM